MILHYHHPPFSHLPSGTPSGRSSAYVMGKPEMEVATEKNSRWGKSGAGGATAPVTTFTLRSPKPPGRRTLARGTTASSPAKHGPLLGRPSYVLWYHLVVGAGITPKYRYQNGTPWAWGMLGEGVGMLHLPAVSVDLNVLCNGDWRVTMPGTQSWNELSSSSISSSSPSSLWGKPSFIGNCECIFLR